MDPVSSAVRPLSSANSLAGSTWAALASHFTQQGWITREKHSHVVQITAEGATCLNRLGLKLSG